MREGYQKPILPDLYLSQPPLETHHDIAALFGPNYRRLIWKCLAENNLLSENGTLPPTFVTLNNHDGSEARYLFDYDIERPDGKHRVLCSVLPSHANSSRHQHPFPEDYYILAGRVYLEGKPIDQGSYRVAPWKFHQMSTKEEPALVVIVMRNAAVIPRELQHIRPISPNGGTIFP